MSTVRRNPNCSAKPSSLPTERQARSRTFGWMNCTSFGFRAKVMTEDGRYQPSSSRRTRPSHRPRTTPERAILSDHSNQDEKSDLGQESDARDGERYRNTSVAERGFMSCLAPCEAPGSKSFRLEIVSVPNADGARCERRRHPRRPKAKSAKGVRRDKAALSSGCEPHPATAPAGSNRSSHGGNEVAEAFD